jgi:hypothetical protein
MQNTSPTPKLAGSWARFSERFLKLFHAYAGWLVSITWRRFFFLAIVLLISMGIIHDLPPLNWTYNEVVPRLRAHRRPQAAAPRTPQRPPATMVFP